MKGDKMDSKTRIIQLQKIGRVEEGYLSIASVDSEIPFPVLRSFITHSTPPDVIRGRHAHYDTEMILVCITGNINVAIEEINGTKTTYSLTSSDQGLYIPKMCWHAMEYKEDSIQLVYCSTLYKEDDYIRDYKVFEELKSTYLQNNT